MNFGPRMGFAWTLGEGETTVIRGGLGYLFSPLNSSTVRQGAANPYIPFRVVYNRTETAARGGKWPMYTDDTAPLALQMGAARKSFSQSLTRTCRRPIPFSR